MESLDKEIYKALEGKFQGLPIKEEYNGLRIYSEFLHYDQGPFSPSTNISQAFELLEGLQWALHTTNDGRVICGIVDGPHKDDPFGRGEATTPAEAICRAYILYKKTKENIER